MISIVVSNTLLFLLSDELGYLVDAIVNEDKIDSFDSRPNNMSLEVQWCSKEIETVMKKVTLAPE